MHLLTFEIKTGETKIGVRFNEEVYSLNAVIRAYNETERKSIAEETSLESIIQKNELSGIREAWNWALENRGKTETSRYAIQDVKVKEPLSNPGKVVCVGNNYMDHCIEQNVAPPKKPMIFSKWATSLIGNGETIELPEESEQVDYEVELTVVIGKTARNVTEEEAMDYVFGYTIMNDVSARDVQFEDVQWVRGKSYDTFAPLGPVIVTKDEIEDPHNLGISLEINGEKLQDSNTSNLIFKIPYIISYLSQGFTFEPGDIIATGTPHGVGVFRDPQIFLQSGDTCKLDIESIGTLENKVR
ncbi:fumarylacetoacetate hydrolase family protein [Salibacterium halotolerans]|uniref:2-keto-4-pentenoate hydratase/2-oxohepta-3-ene-1,7-dioic acid hydratase (Catechol pathway) n=1 Tax=Salibacterium halotolerans TaxID=1884432 RepID=A0A1I5RV57_9BACI|nr:fumarylacetoacetate hydrolase family protein [Salibacterium halotolerans]SFP61836.1 2-keto-4-pentenoate hydratase/2-oxohepta-3-ene-1,7-dioic acid hydratase (catechol pathway) [Salibacterium halotolerans]